MHVVITSRVTYIPNCSKLKCHDQIVKTSWSLDMEHIAIPKYVDTLVEIRNLVRASSLDCGLDPRLFAKDYILLLTKYHYNVSILR